MPRPVANRRAGYVGTCLLIVVSVAMAVESDEDGVNIVDLFTTGNLQLGDPAPLITNILGRDTVSLNGQWNIIVDEHRQGARGIFGPPYFQRSETPTGMELVEHSFDSRRQLSVPGDWNTQDDRLFRYRDVVWYQRDFSVSKKPGQRYFIHFDGVNYSANAYLNGQPLATHDGGYTAFNVEATEAIVDGSNYLVVRVDAKLDETTIPTLKSSDFFKYGGITRDVTLVVSPDTFIRQYHVYLEDAESGSISAWVQLDGSDRAGRLVRLAIDSLNVSTDATADENGRVEFSFTADVDLWSPESPTLYDIDIASGQDRVVDQIGFRTVDVADGQIRLNGEAVFLRGISMHDESYLKAGVAFDRADAEAQLGLVKALNGNFVRLSHYPHNEHTLRAADQLGLMVWSEIPIVSIIDWTNDSTLATARRQLSDNLYRDLNRASIVMWSIANESMPRTDARLAFLEALAHDARSIDDSDRLLAAALVGDPTREFAAVIRRLVAEFLVDPAVTDADARAALEHLVGKMGVDDVSAVLGAEIEVLLEDELGDIVDVIGYNEYFGWYYSGFLARLLPFDEATVRRKMLTIMKDIRFRNVFGKPIIISEFGAGAKKDFRSDKGNGKIWSEEYQAEVYRTQVDMLSRSNAVQGMSPWILKDFRSAMRQLNGIQENYNRKGIVSEKGEKKQAFFVLQEYYREQAISANSNP